MNSSCRTTTFSEVQSARARLSRAGVEPLPARRYHRVLDALACPNCLGVLVEEVDPTRLCCGTCGVSYAVEKGVPILLTEASRILLASGQAPAGPPMRPKWLPGWLADWIRIHCLAGSGEDRHQRSQLAAFVGEVSGPDLVMDLGSGSRRLADHVLTMEIAPFPEVDLVGDGHQLPFRDGTIARIVCTGVLEHVNFPERVVAEMLRVLRPSGRVYVSVPFMQGFHPGSGTQQDFQRYAHIGLLQLLTPFRIITWGISGGPSAALAWILREYLALPFAWSGRLYPIAYLVAGPLTSWPRRLDVLIDRFPQAQRIASGFYVIGEKPDSARAAHEPL